MRSIICDGVRGRGVFWGRAGRGGAGPAGWWVCQTSRKAWTRLGGAVGGLEARGRSGSRFTWHLCELGISHRHFFRMPSGGRHGRAEPGDGLRGVLPAKVLVAALSIVLKGAHSLGTGKTWLEDWNGGKQNATRIGHIPHSRERRLQNELANDDGRGIAARQIPCPARVGRSETSGWGS